VTELVVGIDAGVTSTRALIATLDGAVVGRGAAPGANSGFPQGRFAAVLASALGGLDPARVCGGVLGSCAAVEPAVVRSAADMAWWSAGFGGRPEVVTDLETAFASGTPQPDGLLLQAGAGAAAAALRHRRIARRCDGYGWPLGDQGSAAWLGLRGARAALDAWDGRGPATRLCAHLAEQVGARPDEDLAQVLVTRLHAADPAQLGSLAPLVTRAAEAGDRVAAGLVEAAADRLVAGLYAVTSGDSSGDPSGDSSGQSPRALSGELVLAGTLLAGGPVRSAVLQRLAGFALQVRSAGSGAAGAAALALAARGVLDPDVHARLIGAVS
jgi:N-acetylglucosamine kinase-like BadF-type ATPase